MSQDALDSYDTMGNRSSYNHVTKDSLHELDVLDGKYEIKIKFQNFIGQGNYGRVYYVGNIEGVECVAKITNSRHRTDNEYHVDHYFYAKYNATQGSTGGLPRVIDIGKTGDKIGRAILDYMILEYVGVRNLFEIWKTRIIGQEEKILFQMTFVCLYKHLTSFHKLGMICRDVSTGNIVLNDRVTSFLISKNKDFSEGINGNMQEIVFKPTTLGDITNQYLNESYGNIVKFVDGGLFADLDCIHNANEYDRKNMYFSGEFPDFDRYDGMFACTMLYISPFYLFNLSSMIKEYENANTTVFAKHALCNILKMADIWSLCIMYTIHIHDVCSKGLNHKMISDIKCRTRRFDKFAMVPFEINESRIMLVINLVDILIYGTEYHDLRRCVSRVLGEIMLFVNVLLSKGVLTRYVYELQYNDEIVNLLYQESAQKLQNVYDILDQFNGKLRELILCE